MKIRQPIRWSLQVKVVTAAIAALAMLALVLGDFYGRQIGQAAQVASEKRSVAIASGVANECEYGLLTGNKLFLRHAMLNALTHGDVVSAVVFDAHGKLLAAAGHVDEAEKGGEGPGLVARFQQAAVTKDSSGLSEDHSETFYSAVYLKPNLVPRESAEAGTAAATNSWSGPRLGLVELTVSLEAVNQAVQDAQQTAWLIAVVSTLVVAALCALAVRRIVRPLRALVTSTRQLAVGNLGVHVLSAGTDEVGELTEAFNDMVEALTRSQSELLDYQRTLEQRVVESTAELRSANEQLKRDVTERKRLQEQLLQAQKMEAIGRLAGGVAHDFNNVLTAIEGYSELLLRQLGAESSLRRNAEEIERAAYRAGRLTRQLLAFSRKQMLQPRVFDLNAVVTELERMLRRVIGEHIELRTALAPDLGNVKADPGQIEQVILNLVVNARDAMPEHGVLTIATGEVTLSEPVPGAESAGAMAPVRVADTSSSGPADLPPGDYVTLSVTDTGMGMSGEVQQHLFEPFFTTKPVGQGTGLGLATCYGILKQSGGHISVYSELGQGTCFKIYLPRVAATSDRSARLQVCPLSGGNEAILFVEDEATLRELGTMVLAELGYEVLSAANGVDALRLAEERNGRDIALLLTDVVMPRMGGRELAEVLRQRRPSLRVLYTSGYTEDAVVHRGVIDSDIAFLQKPYTPSTLARKVREVLDLPVGQAKAGA